MEKYHTISLAKYLVFNDSLQFLGSIIVRLAKNLEKSGLETFLHLGMRFHKVEAKDMSLLVRMEIYPDEYLDTWEKIPEEITPKEAVYTTPTDSDI